jgi:3'-phosphoadenosine 5'-phosphosulfate sulfotransferase (PAPS reductase)/FAD synthetase
MTRPVIHLVSMSSGKDSTATALLALERFPREEVQFVFADTGNEDQIVYDYLDYLEEKLDIEIARLKQDFSDRINAKRMFIARDQRVGRRKGRKVRWTNKEKRRALSVLHPTGNPFLDLCLWKGRFPARRSQFCTEHLKTIPLARHLHGLIDDGYEVVSWQGVRRDESAAREDALIIQYMDEHFWTYRPIVDWTAEDCFALHRRHDVKPNPLYTMGMKRVGCMPCVNCGKMDIREIAARFPEHIDRIEEWEPLVAAASKRGDATFFPHPERDWHILKKGDIRSRVRWAHTARGGKQFDLTLVPEGPGVCSSSYGLCE